MFLQPLQDFILRQVFAFLIAALFDHFDACVEQECAENIQYPFETADQHRADKNHNSTQDDGPEYAV